MPNSNELEIHIVINGDRRPSASTVRKAVKGAVDPLEQRGWTVADAYEQADREANSQ